MQQTHFASDGLFCTKHTSQLQFSGALNISPSDVEEVREEELVEEEAVVDCVEVWWGELSGPGEVRVTGEAKPKERREGELKQKSS